MTADSNPAAVPFCLNQNRPLLLIQIPKSKTLNDEKCLFQSISKVFKDKLLRGPNAPRKSLDMAF